MTARPRLWLVALYAVLVLLLVAPILAVPAPDLVLGDYQNHLARVHILSTIAQSPSLQKFYDPHWHLMPYLGMDVPVALLARGFGIYAAGKIFVAFCALLPLLAVCALRRAVFGRVGLAPAAAALIGYNFLLALGFLTYLFTACCAVLVFALWIRAEGWPVFWRLAVFLPASLLLFLGHSLAFAAYGVMLASWEIGAALPRGRAGWRRSAMMLSCAAAQAVAPLALSQFVHVADTFGAAHVTRYGSLGERMAALLGPFFFPGSEALPAVLLVSAGIALAVWRGVRLSAPAAAVLAALGAVSLAMPHMVRNIWGMDLRFPLLLAMAALGLAAPRRVQPGWVRGAAAGLVLGLAAWRAVSAGLFLHALAGQQAELRSLLRALPEGRRLLVLDAPQNAPGRLAPRAFIQHMSLAAAIDRNAFVPSLFAGTTPIFLRPAMQNSASQGVPPLDFAQLWQGYTTPAPPGDLPPAKDGGSMYWLGWPGKFDNVLIMNFGAALPVLPEDLRRIAGNAVGVLFVVESPPGARGFAPGPH